MMAIQKILVVDDSKTELMVLSDLQKRDVTLRVLNQPREFTSLDQMLDQASHDLDALKRLDHSRPIKRGIALAKKAREQAA